MYSKLKEREKKILNHLYEDNSITSTQLCERFGITVVTLRKDLDHLESNGLIIRTHGGAVPVYDATIIERQKLNNEEKQAIAKAAADMINEGDRIMISAGTTSSLILRHLHGKRNIHVVTNSTLLLTYSRMNPHISITLVGGEFMPSAEAIAGTIALRELDQFHVSKAFIGADGYSIEGGITAHHTELAEICKKMINRSERTILISDISKYNKKGFAYIGELNQLDTLITGKLPDTGIKELSELGLKIITV